MSARAKAAEAPQHEADDHFGLLWQKIKSHLRPPAVYILRYEHNEWSDQLSYFSRGFTVPTAKISINIDPSYCWTIHNSTLKTYIIPVTVGEAVLH